MVQNASRMPELPGRGALVAPIPLPFQDCCMQTIFAWGSSSGCPPLLFALWSHFICEVFIPQAPRLLCSTNIVASAPRQSPHVFPAFLWLCGRFSPTTAVAETREVPKHGRSIKQMSPRDSPLGSWYALATLPRLSGVTENCQFCSF